MNFSWQRGLPVPVCIALGSIKLSGARRAIWGMLASADFYLFIQASHCLYGTTHEHFPTGDAVCAPSDGLPVVQSQGSQTHQDVTHEAEQYATALNAGLDKFELQQLLSGPYDRSSATLSVQVRHADMAACHRAAHQYCTGQTQVPMWLYAAQEGASQGGGCPASGSCAEQHVQAIGDSSWGALHMSPSDSPSRAAFWSALRGLTKPAVVSCRLGQAARIRRTGLPCCCACTCAGLRNRASSVRSWSSVMVRLDCCSPWMGGGASHAASIPRQTLTALHSPLLHLAKAVQGQF